MESLPQELQSRVPGFGCGEAQLKNVSQFTTHALLLFLMDMYITHKNAVGKRCESVLLSLFDHFCCSAECRDAIKDIDYWHNLVNAGGFDKLC